MRDDLLEALYAEMLREYARHVDWSVGCLARLADEHRRLLARERAWTEVRVRHERAALRRRSARP